jgi:hypothetical protein
MSSPAPASVALPIPGAPKDAEEARLLAEEIRVGLDRMRRMSHDELRNLVQSRIEMLDGVLTEREKKREAMETARLASAVLDHRRTRAHTIRRRVDAWSAVAAVACLGFVLVHM